MADRDLRHHLALIVFAGLLVACNASLGSLAADRGVASQALVRIDELRAVAARLTPGEVQVLEFVGTAPDAGWHVDVVASSSLTTGQPVSVNLSVSDRAFVYGTAPPSASRVLLTGLTAEGGQVTDGAWVLVLPDADALPTDLRWRVVDATGHTLASGEGLTIDDAG